MGWETLLEKIALAYPVKGVSESTHRVKADPPTEKPSMSLSIKAAIAQTEAAIKSEKDTDKLMALYSDLKAYKHVYKKTTEETEKFQDEEEDAKKADEDASKSDDEKKADDEGEEDAKDGDDDDSKSGGGDDSSSTDGDSEKASKDRAAVIAMLTADIRGASGKQKETLKASLSAIKLLQEESLSRRAKNAALKGENKALSALSKDVASLKAAQTDARRDAIIDSRRADLTPAERKSLKTKDIKYVKAFLDACPPGRLRHLTDPTNPDTHANAQAIGREHGGAPDSVIAEVTSEMREAALRVEELSGGRIKAADSIKAYKDEAISIVNGSSVSTQARS